MTGGTVPPFPVTVNVSVWHRVASEPAMPRAVLTEPARILKFEAVTVLGPVITKVVMSMRSWKKYLC